MTFFLSRIVLLSLLALGATSCSRYYEGPVSDHFDGDEFHNSGARRGDIRYAKMIWQVFTTDVEEWPEQKVKSYDKPPKRVEGSRLRVSYVGHAATLIQTQGLNILTDPVWGERASPFSWVGPKRIIAAGIKFEDLPPIDVVLVSHNHYDHMDTETISRLWYRDKPIILVPLGNDKILTDYDENIKSFALDWGEAHPIQPGVEIALEPMFHWSRRWILDYNEALWGAFVIKLPKIEGRGGDIYFAADSGFGQGRYYKEAQAKYKGFRLSLLPIGAYSPEWFMGYAHQKPEEAVKAHQLINARNTLGIHFGVFDLTLTPFGEPQKRLEKAKKQQGVPKKSFRSLDPGEFWWIP